MTYRTLMFGVVIPDADDLDPDIVAEELVAIINEERERNGGPSDAITVSLFPACQWLTPEGMERLRFAALPDNTEGAE